MEEEVERGNVVFVEQDDGSIRAFKKDYLTEDRIEKPTSLYDQATTDDATKEFNDLLPEARQLLFTKPTALLKHLVSLARISDGDVVFDFFAGSCTTAQAVMELNREDDVRRRFVMVQMPEPTDHPDFPTVADIGRERIRRVIARMQEGDEDGQLSLDLRPDEDGPHSAGLGFKVFKLSPSTFRQW